MAASAAIFISGDSMARKKKVNDDERLDDNTVERVIKYLSEKGATKKVACQMMNIAYNTTRLDKIIEHYKSKKESDAKRRAEKRGTPATEAEIQFIISEYLEGNTIDSISKSLFRGTTLIKSVLERFGVPERNSSPDYFHPKLIPEESMRNRFSVGEKVWSARYDTLAEICGELFQKGQYVYKVYLYGNWSQYGYQPACELASLETIKGLGINV